MEHHCTQLNTLFPGFQGPHIRENEVNDIKLKLVKLLQGYLSFLAPFCPRDLINKVLAEVSEVQNSFSSSKIFKKKSRLKTVK